ncbi:TonB-dependent receptor domain-containing protein [Pseudobacter ginsenosidimutans]|uniref:Outer membrane receptor protein involved in Fe transport n=1 Tax=Pseudobacter ginsenosidimutans TaxID=661488 RepID=A0A4Q7N0E3_9BACT|nr:TonB-dependent receptor [Pseudobacter ginsenosidimutans]QEC43258.1 TonB-dependent receptor [Pseudobacter ginsenosidimutans]RZS74622.1 outer membrane receptor protein involved in Fe transport [Pseudobacter ginsenosidimutans]
MTNPPRSYPVFLVLLLSIASSATAQQRIHSVVIDSLTRKPVAHATVVLLNEKQQQLGSTTTSEAGSFNLNGILQSKFTLLITAISYSKKELNGQSIPDTIWLAPAVEGLREVTVSSRKKLVESRPGMLVYHAANDATNKGGTAADVLRKAPVLNVDAQGNVSMRGSKNLKILVNGKYSGQMARNAADALNMMPADIIQSVEVITTPSARYDAEGAAGVINIITKKGRKEFSGALEAAGSNLEQVLNPRIAINQEKWNIALNGHLHRYRTKEAVNTNRQQWKDGIPDGELIQQQESDNAAPHGSGDLTITFKPDSVSEFNFGVNTWFGKWPHNRQQQTIVKQAGGAISDQYLQTTTAKENYLGADFNLGYTRKFKRPGQEFNLLAQFSPSHSRNPYQTWLTENIHTLPVYEEINSNKTRNREWTAQADYQHPILDEDRMTLETGVKIILRNVNNQYSTSSGNPQDPAGLQPDPLRTDQFKYSQDVYSAYALLKNNFKKDWYLEGGLRVERTEIKGRFSSGPQFNNNFTNFIPNITVSKKLNDEHHLSLSYTQRLTRPYIWDLNPNIDASDPKNHYSGNPDLEPETMHQAELVYGWNRGTKFFLNSSLFWKQTDDAIVDYTQTNAEGISSTKKQNLAGNKMYGLNFSSNAMINSWLSLNGNFNVNHLEFTSQALHIFNEGWAADIDLNATIKLPNRFSVQAFGEYSTRMITLQGHESYQYMYTFAVKKEIVKPKLSITAAAINPFSTYIPQEIVLQSASFHSLATNRYYLRAFKLTVNWEFGNIFQQKTRKKIVNDDIKGNSKG